MSLKKFIEIISEEHPSLLKGEVEDKILKWLSNFQCGKNKDVENYIHKTALIHHKKDISRTYLIITVVEEKLEIIAYYTLAMKSLKLKGTLDGVSGSKRKKMNFDRKNECMCILIGQLGKNDHFKEYINLNEILDFALSTVKEIVALIGGRVILIECSNNPKLINLYKKHDFIFLQTENELSQLMILNT